MTKHTYFDGTHGHIVVVYDNYFQTRHVTTAARPDQYIRLDDHRRDNPQLCAGGTTHGATLNWDSSPDKMGEAFADDVGGTYHETREAFDAAVDHAIATARPPVTR